MTEIPKRTMGPRPHGPRSVVRAGNMDETLARFMGEVGHQTIGWYGQNIEPRLRALEWRALPWYRKRWYRFLGSKLVRWFAKTKLGLWFTAKVGKKQPAPESPPQPDEVPETAERQTRACAKCGKMFIVHDQSRICPVCVAEANR